jgi:hypothetical protein
VKWLIIFAALVLLVFGATVTVIASTATGATTMLDLATAGLPADVDVSVVSDTAVVPHEYALHNECYFSGKVSGPANWYQTDDIVNWIYSAPPPYRGVPHAIMTVYLNTVPAGATCKVFLVQGNRVVKGSTTEYKVLQR